MRLVITYLCLFLLKFGSIEAEDKYVPCLDGCNVVEKHSDGIHEKKKGLDLVVAHCCEDSKWIPDIIQKYPNSLNRIFIYLKCFEKRNSTNCDGTSLRTIRKHISTPMKIIQVKENDSGWTTDECGAYLTHFHHLSEKIESPYLSIGALMVHGSPKSHWDEQLIDTLLSTVSDPRISSVTSSLSSSKSKKHSQHEIISKPENLSSLYFSVNRHFWDINEWPGGSLGMVTGECMHNLVETTYSMMTLDQQQTLNTSINTNWENSSYVQQAASITTYSNAMFFVGYDVIRRRPSSFWKGAHKWIFEGHHGSGCANGKSRKRGGHRSDPRCRLLERSWHVVMCQPCALPSRESDSRLPLAFRSTSVFHFPSQR